MKITWQRAELLFCFLLFALLAGALAIALGWNQRAGLFPWIVLVPTLALTLWQLVDDARGKTTRPAAVIGDQGEAAALEADLTAPAMVRRQLLIAGWIVAFFLMIWLLGFTVGGTLATLAYLRFRREGWRVSLVYSLLTFLLLDVVFRQLIRVPFEPGVIFDLLGVAPGLPSIR